MHQFFRAIDVDINNARDLFELLDCDGSGSIDREEFMDGCLKIWTPAKGMDLKTIARDINMVRYQVRDMMTMVSNLCQQPPIKRGISYMSHAPSSPVQREKSSVSVTTAVTVSPKNRKTVT